MSEGLNKKSEGIAVKSEGPVRITKTAIEAAWKRRAPGQRIVIRDETCRGLALVVNSTSMAWRFDYKPRGVDPLTGKRFPSRSVTIGTPASHDPEAARTDVNAVKGETKAGTDVAVEKRKKQAVEAAKRASTVAKLIDVYVEDLPKRPKMRGRGLPSAKYVANEIAHLRAAAVIMKVGSKAVADIVAADLRKLAKANADQPATARHRFGSVERFLDWALDEGHITVNPAHGVSKRQRPKPAAARTRYQTAEQVAILWKAAGGMERPVHRDLARFLFVIPARRQEAARMAWEHVNLDTATWGQPDSMTKNGDPHRLHLPELALSILRGRYEDAGRPAKGLVFPGPRSGRPIVTWSDIKEELVDLSGFADWSWHDLRRSFVTALGEAGFDETIADACLNHRPSATRGGVLGVYQHAGRHRERQAALEAWGNMLAAAIEDRPVASNVTPLVVRK
ncbi:tyrosine-type recombinase/integrase [Castellaniella sp.]|uniref:tyrosine-type recombinase/integrase n=1 Tax=Castellaniella sp. TaxID=1955812 RepID=UPI002AFDFBD2|nr:tyrosine-type recombinase/integrase [Castellaniella sp.]